MWTSPNCGRRFTGRNMWHSCVKLSVDDRLARVPAWVGELYRGFGSMVRACGPVEIVPVKTDDELAAWVAESYRHGAGG